MKSPQILALMARVENIYGGQNVHSYGSNEDEQHGAGFLLSGVPATFSVHTQDGSLADGMYDIQIESNPPGDYIYSDVVPMARFLELVDRICGPKDQWPEMTK